MVSFAPKRSISVPNFGYCPRAVLDLIGFKYANLLRLSIRAFYENRQIARGSPQNVFLAIGG